MAKIYETKEDYQRDQLTEQATHMRNKSNTHSEMGWTLLVGGLFTDIFNLTRQTKSKFFHYLTGVLLVGSAVELVQTWRYRSKARTLEAERDRMGPQQVILPLEMVSANAATSEKKEPEKECPSCKIKKYAGAMTPKTHLELAESAASDSNSMTRH